MHKKYLTTILTLIFVAFSHHSNAVDSGVGLVVKNFKQFEGGWENDLMNDIAGKTIHSKGCIISNMSNILYYHGLRWVPDDSHEADTITPINPGSFNKWLKKPNIKGYKTSTAEMWPGAVKKFYYKNTPFYNMYKTVMPNDDCWPLSNTYDFGCFKVGWSDPNAKTFLDNDLKAGQPDIANIKGYYETTKDGNPILKAYNSHFVTVTGSSTIYPSDPYHVEDPGRSYKTWAIGIPLARLYPKLLQPDNQATQIAMFGENKPAFKILEIRRYTAGYGMGNPNLSQLGATVHSPVEIQMIDPKGRTTGYDPISGTMLQGNPKGLYYTETVSSIDSEEQPEDPIKTLWIDEPAAGNYILKIFGTGDGPYTIDLYGETREGVTNLDTSLTGTAYAGLQAGWDWGQTFKNHLTS